MVGGDGRTMLVIDGWVDDHDHHCSLVVFVLGCHPLRNIKHRGN